MVTYCNVCRKENAKYHCGKCKLVNYCSSECQINDWKERNHKVDCQKSLSEMANNLNANTERLIKTVVVEGSTPKEVSVPESDLTKGVWETCIVPGMIGVPLMVKQLERPKVKSSNELAIFFMVDPISGLAAPKWQLQVGIVQFAKTDKTDFSVDLWWDVYSYILHLMDFYGDESFNYNRFKTKNLIPTAFRNYQAKEHQNQQNYKASNAQNKSCLI